MTNIVSCDPATSISEAPLDVKLMQCRSFMSSCLDRQAYQKPTFSTTIHTNRQDIPDVPYRQPPTHGHVHGPRAEGNDALVMEEELADRAFGGGVYPERGVSL